MNRRQVERERDSFRQEVKRSGRSKVAVLCSMVANYLKYRVYPSEYYLFGFRGMDAKNKKTYFTYKDRKRLAHKINNIKYKACFFDKYLFSRVFEDLYKRPAYRTDLIGTEELGALCAESPRIIYKPVADSQGNGITIFDTAEKPVSELLAELRALPVGIVEGWIRQSAEMNSLYPDTVNCIRVVSVTYKGEVTLTGATLTLGSHKSRVANADAGAVFALVDENTGEVISDFVCYDDPSTILTEHPDTGRVIKGYRIGHWDEIKALVNEAARRVPQIGYASWDIAVREDGPILIEGNSYGGYTGYQVAGIARDGHGTKHKYEKYL